MQRKTFLSKQSTSRLLPSRRGATSMQSIMAVEKSTGDHRVQHRAAKSAQSTAASRSTTSPTSACSFVNNNVKRPCPWLQNRSQGALIYCSTKLNAIEASRSGRPLDASRPMPCMGTCQVSLAQPSSGTEVSVPSWRSDGEVAPCSGDRCPSEQQPWQAVAAEQQKIHLGT